MPDAERIINAFGRIGGAGAAAVVLELGVAAALTAVGAAVAVKNEWRAIRVAPGGALMGVCPPLSFDAFGRVGGAGAEADVLALGVAAALTAVGAAVAVRNEWRAIGVAPGGALMGVRPALAFDAFGRVGGAGAAAVVLALVGAAAMTAVGAAVSVRNEWRATAVAPDGALMGVRPPSAFDAFGRIDGAGAAADVLALVGAATVAAVGTAVVSSNESGGVAVAPDGALAVVSAPPAVQVFGRAGGEYVLHVDLHSRFLLFPYTFSVLSAACRV